MDLSRAILTPHARQRMARRGITSAEVHAVLAAPEAVINATPARMIAQGRIRGGGCLLRIVVDVRTASCEIVTAYLTSKRAEYRSRP